MTGALTWVVGKLPVLPPGEVGMEGMGTDTAIVEQLSAGSPESCQPTKPTVTNTSHRQVCHRPYMQVMPTEQSSRQRRKKMERRGRRGGTINRFRGNIGDITERGYGSSLPPPQ